MQLDIPGTNKNRDEGTSKWQPFQVYSENQAAKEEKPSKAKQKAGQRLPEPPRAQGSDQTRTR